MPTPITVPLNEKQLAMIQNIQTMVATAEKPYQKAMAAYQLFFDLISTCAAEPVPDGSAAALVGSTIIFSPPESIMLPGDTPFTPPAPPTE